MRPLGGSQRGGKAGQFPAQKAEPLRPLFFLRKGRTKPGRRLGHLVLS